MGIKFVEDIEVTKPGRPVQERGAELQAAIEQAIEQDKLCLVVDLNPDEKERFYRFLQRCRNAAKRVGVKVNVAVSKENPDTGIVRVIKEENV